MKVEFYHIDAFEVPNYEPIWRGLRSYGIEANLVGVPDPQNTAVAGWFDFDRFAQYCNERNMPFTTEADPQADFAMTTQNIDILSNYKGIKSRIMYGPIAYPSAWGLQEHTIRPFDAVLTHGQYYVDFYTKWATSTKLPIVGYPRYDDYFAGKIARTDVHRRWGIVDSRPVLVFLPTWGENTAFEKFFPVLAQLSNRFNIVLRPHHCTLRLEQHRMQIMIASRFRILDHAFDLAEVYAGADVVVSDVRGGGLYESCLCDVPTVGMVIDPAEKTGWLAKSGVDKIISLCSEPSQLEFAIDMAMHSTLQREYRSQWMDQRVAYRDGTSGRQAALAIARLIEEKAHHKTFQVAEEVQAKGVNITTKKKIVFLLGSAHLSGGTYVILQHAMYLKKMGYDVTVALIYMKLEEYIELKNSTKCWHPALHELHFSHISELENIIFDVGIFTWWATVTYFPKVNAKTYLYFVQSIESRFYAADENFMRDLVSRTYKIGLPVITEATWIKNFLSEHFNSDCALVKNGIAKDVYTLQGQAHAEKPSGKLRILVEGPIDAPYKNVSRTVQLCQEANIGEIWLLTSSDVKEFAGVDRVFSQVPVDSVPNIYRSCDVIVKLSYVEGMFGPPLEMFHCGGTAIVYDVTGHDEYIIHNYNALVAKTNDEAAVVKYLQMLHEDRDLLHRLKDGAVETASSWISWDESSKEFINVIESYSTQPISDAKKMSYSTNVQMYLSEHIVVNAVKANQLVQRQFTALPLYDSGYYELVLPLETDCSKLEIMLGKKYRAVAIKNVVLLKQHKTTSEITFNDVLPALSFVSNNMIKTHNHDVFECASDMSSLLIMVNQSSFDHMSYHYFFRVELHPIQVDAQTQRAVQNLPVGF